MSDVKFASLIHYIFYKVYIKRNVKYPSTIPMIPMMIPTFSISFCFTRPVECAMALGGVLIGRHIDTDAVMAMAMSMVVTPPMLSSLSPIPLHTTANTGTRSAVVAVLLMKFDMA